MQARRAGADAVPRSTLNAGVAGRSDAGLTDASAIGTAPDAGQTNHDAATTDAGAGAADPQCSGLKARSDEHCTADADCGAGLLCEIRPRAAHVAQWPRAPAERPAHASTFMPTHAGSMASMTVTPLRSYGVAVERGTQMSYSTRSSTSPSRIVISTFHHPYMMNSKSN